MKPFSTQTVILAPIRKVALLLGLEGSLLVGTVLNKETEGSVRPWPVQVCRSLLSTAQEQLLAPAWGRERKD